MKIPSPIIENVPLGSLKRYLSATGWRRHLLPNNNDLFSFSKDEDIEIVLPATSEAKDLRERVKDALTTLMPLEKRDPADIIDAIRSVSFDLIHSRLPDAAIRHDTISLGTAEEFIRRMTRVLAASAHGELHVGPYFQRVSSTALTYADQCRFGHTFRGSFGFTIESPVGPNTIETGQFLPAPPLERRTVIRLARGLRIIELAIRQDDPQPIISNYDKGLNANACEELADLIAIPQIGEIAFDLIFSPEWGLPQDVDLKSHATVGHSQALAIMADAAKGLRIVNYEKQRTILGKVRTLHSMEDSPADFFTISGLQDVMLEWDSVEFGKRLVRVSLGPEEYLLAVEAHKSGLMVSVFGELERGPFRLDNARDFKVVS